MPLNDHEKIQKEIEKKAAQRLAKRKPKMKVSGKSIIKLQKLIREKK